MDELWDRLREATNNDEALVAFLQQLLTLDPEPRCDFTKLVEATATFGLPMCLHPSALPQLLLVSQGH